MVMYWVNTFQMIFISNWMHIIFPQFCHKLAFNTEAMHNWEYIVKLFHGTPKKYKWQAKKERYLLISFVISAEKISYRFYQSILKSFLFHIMLFEVLSKNHFPHNCNFSLPLVEGTNILPWISCRFVWLEAWKSWPVLDDNFRNFVATTATRVALD